MKQSKFDKKNNEPTYTNLTLPVPAVAGAVHVTVTAVFELPLVLVAPVFCKS